MITCNILDYMKRAAPGCDTYIPKNQKLNKGGAAHEKDSLCWC
jgi:hypothetical protein